jgi:hypothetical protein
VLLGQPLGDVMNRKSTRIGPVNSAEENNVHGTQLILL